jgi:hypothetical protein
MALPHFSHAQRGCAFGFSYIYTISPLSEYFYTFLAFFYAFFVGPEKKQLSSGLRRDKRGRIEFIISSGLYLVASPFTKSISPSRMNPFL